jgi:TonB family protein
MMISTTMSFAVTAASPPALTWGQAAKVVIYSPLPKYPSFAQRLLIQRTRGAYMQIFSPNPKGVFALRVDIRTGRVKNVVIARSTGEAVLDAEVLRALRQWRFKTGALPHLATDPSAKDECLVKVPVTFRL